MAEKITYGIKNVYAAKITITNGAITFGTPAALPGASEITLSTAGEDVRIYADNVVYYKTGVNQGYTGTLSLYAIPDTFYTDYLGYIKDDNDVLVEAADGAKADFALLFEFDTDTAKTKRTVLYNVTASRPEISSSTKEDKIDPQPFAIPITASPAIDTGYVKASIVGDEDDETWAGWFTAVYTTA